jgi:SpoIID/LytB domain protein
LFSASTETGTGFYYSDSPDKTAGFYTAEIAKNPDELSNYFNLASVYKEFGENKKAFDVYRDILLADSGNIRARFEEGKMYYFSGAYNFASEEFKWLEKNGNANWEVYYWWGCALLDGGDACGAIDKFELSARKDGYKNIIYLKTAEAYEKMEDITFALNYYNKALSRDRTYTELNRKIAQLHEKKSEFVSAYKYWNEAGKIDSSDTEAKKKMQKYSEIVPAVKKMISSFLLGKKNSRDAYVPPVKKNITGPGTELIPLVKIGIVSGVTSIFFKCGSDFTVTDASCNTLMAGEKMTEYEVEIDGKRAYISNDGGRTQIKKEAFINKADPEATTSVYNIAYGEGFYWVEKADTTYRGDFIIRVNGKKDLTLINELNMEEYMYGVIAAEIPSTWPEESLKAQAVAVRTYTIMHMTEHEREGYNLCSTQHCAMYKGVSGETKKTNAAVDATRGEVLFGPDKKPVSTYFSHCCGGRTQDVADIWGDRNAKCLTGVYDGEDSGQWQFPLTPFMLEEWVRSSPKCYCSADGEAETSYRWIRYLNAGDLERNANRKYKLGRIKNIKPLKRAKDGAITKIRLEGESGSENIKFDMIRNVLGKIRSNVIKWEYSRDADGFIKDIYIYGAGWGHSVGMCQRGIKGMAIAGKNYRDMLYHYYRDSEIKKQY